MRKSMTRKEALKKADKWFSIYIRIRDANQDGNISCITCGRIVHWTKAHAGHFQRRALMATRFEEMNVHAQCSICNTFREGEQYRHGKAINLLHGRKTADWLISRSKRTVKYSKENLDDIARENQEEARELAKAKGLDLGAR